MNVKRDAIEHDTGFDEALMPYEADTIHHEERVRFDSIRFDSRDGTTCTIFSKSRFNKEVRLFE